MKRLRELLEELYHNNYRFKNFKILGRTACLGNEVVARIGWNKNYINHQKSRVDYLLELHRDSSISHEHTEVANYLKNRFVIGTIRQQKKDFFKYRRPDVIMMDSYSELTDQVFVNTKNNKKFLANYGDVDHALLPEYYRCLGLIEDELYSSYDLFFSKINHIYKGVPVYFIHFSAALDTRKKFKKRAEKIKKAMSELSRKYEFIRIIDIDSKQVEWANEGDHEYRKYPYHYSDGTYKKFTRKLLKRLEEDGVLNV